MSGKLQQAREMQLHINFHENLGKMRKAAGLNVFNDGEVIVQNVSILNVDRLLDYAPCVITATS